jgi:type VI secretion system protein ImpL
VLKLGLAPVAPDDDLVARARETFAKVSPAQRAYSRIRLSSAAQQLPPWRPVDVLGPAGAKLFSRLSGKPLTDGIPGLLTVDGFHRVLLPSLTQSARDVAAEGWVAGPGIRIDTGSAQKRRLERDIIGLYEKEYVQAWDAMLADLSVNPLSSISQGAQDLYILESPQSPMRNLVVSIARQLTLSVSPSAAPGLPDARKPAEPASGQGDSIDRWLQPLIGNTSTASPRAAASGHEIDERYSALRELADAPAPRIDQVLRCLNDMQQQFAKAAAAASGIAVLAGMGDPSPALRVEALRQPEPLARWLTTLATSGAALRNGDTKR